MGYLGCFSFQYSEYGSNSCPFNLKGVSDLQLELTFRHEFVRIKDVYPFPHSQYVSTGTVRVFVSQLVKKYLKGNKVSFSSRRLFLPLGIPVPKGDNH